MSATETSETASPLQFLVGTWVGRGHGAYPTIASFDFTEEVTFEAVPGKTFLAYRQRTRHATEGRPLHAESGFWRWTGGAGPDPVGVEVVGVEVVLAHAFGICEILEGRVTGHVVELSSRLLSSSRTAKVVEATTRRFEAGGDELRYDVAMAAAGRPLTHHLQATLHRRS